MSASVGSQPAVLPARSWDTSKAVVVSVDACLWASVLAYSDLEVLVLAGHRADPLNECRSWRGGQCGAGGSA